MCSRDYREHRTVGMSALAKYGEICSSDDLVVGGLGVRFEVMRDYNSWQAFVIRHSCGVAAYINRCAHLALELDWSLGSFFDLNQRHIICATHGARYAADTGECIGGACNGSGLESLKVIEKKGSICLQDPIYVLYHPE